MGAPDRLRAGLREAEMFHLAALNQLLYRARDLLDRHVRIDAMLVQQIDGVQFQPLERTIDDLPDVLGPAVEVWKCLHVESELRRDDHLAAYRGEGFAQELFIRE